MAYVQGDKVASGSASGLTTPGITTTTGNLMVAVINLGTGPKTLSSITDSKGNTWTALTGSPQSPVAQYNVYAYYCANITGGAGHTVTTTHSGAGVCALSVAEFSGRATTSPIIFQAASVEGSVVSSHTSTSTGTLSESGSDVVCLVGDNAFDQTGSNETYTATSSGWVLPAAAANTTGATTGTSFIMYKNNATTSAEQAAWDNAPGNVASGIFIAAFKAAGGGGGGSKLLSMINNQAGF